MSLHWTIECKHVHAIFIKNGVVPVKEFVVVVVVESAGLQDLFPLLVGDSFEGCQVGIDLRAKVLARE